MPLLFLLHTGKEKLTFLGKLRAESKDSITILHRSYYATHITHTHTHVVSHMMLGIWQALHRCHKIEIFK